MEPTPDCPFELFRDSILVEALKVERIGIITPDNATQSADTFKTVVVGVGPGYTNDSGRDIKPEVQIGDEVIVDMRNSVGIGWLKSRQFYLANTNSILARVKPDSREVHEESKARIISKLN